MRLSHALRALAAALILTGCGGRGGPTEENPVDTGSGSITNADGAPIGGGRIDQGGGNTVPSAEPGQIGGAAPANTNTPPITPRKSVTE